MSTSTLNQARAALARARTPEDEARALVRIGWLLLDSGAASQAVRVLTPAPDKALRAGAPDLVGCAWATLHAAFDATGADTAAAVMHERAARAYGPYSPHLPALQANRGYSLLRRRQFEPAVHELACAIESGTAAPKDHAHLALALVGGGDRAGAERVAISTDAADAWTALCLARVWWHLGAWREAKQAADHAARMARSERRPDWRRSAAQVIQAAERSQPPPGWV